MQTPFLKVNDIKKINKLAVYVGALEVEIFECLKTAVLDKRHALCKIQKYF
jgi:hypothetical protein